MTYNDLTAAKLRAELAYRRLSARELARRIGVSQSYLAARMSGAVDFRTGDLERIAIALDVPVTTLLPDVERAA